MFSIKRSDNQQPMIWGRRDRDEDGGGGGDIWDDLIRGLMNIWTILIFF